MRTKEIEYRGEIDELDHALDEDLDVCVDAVIPLLLDALEIVLGGLVCGVVGGGGALEDEIGDGEGGGAGEGAGAASVGEETLPVPPGRKVAPEDIIGFYE